MLSFLKNLFDENAKRIRSYQKLIDKINSLEDNVTKLNDDELSTKTDYFKKQLKKGKTLDDILPEAFAVVREAIKRTIGERAYDVQLMAAITLHQGAIAEQRTGEGKTHSVIFPAYLNALTGRGVHIITPNDYLTRVGTGWYSKALNLLGISTSCIIHEQSFLLDPKYTDETEKVDDRLAHLKPISRQEAYLADVTYGTNNEFGFDYLRDHMAQTQDQVVQRPHYFAIVDEVDFVLIDEARTPLIISSPNNQPTDKYYKFAQIAADLQPTDYTIDEKARSATLSEYGIRKVERTLNVGNLYEESFETIHYIENAIKARALFHKDKDYVIKDGQVIIVDEFTGRLMDGRRWSDGLHQAVEAKEGVAVQRESQTWATITFQNYFRLYEKLAGMTGTAATEAEEFKKIYNLDVVVIPTNKDIQRIDEHDFIFKTQRSKYAAIAAFVEERYKVGQPVLIGTTSIEKNEVISSLLRKKALPHQVLNAKNHLSEAQIIAQAGKKSSITVATNMAGRGVDIILGGPKDKVSKDKWQKEHDEVIKLGGLCVLGTERHESRRIDNQLRGRAGRQGDPGFSRFYVALDDDIMRIFGGEKISSLMGRFNMPEDVPLTHPLVSKVIEQIQVKVEGFHFDSRKNLVEYDDVINKQRQIVYKIRDQVLLNQKNSSDKNQELVFKYLSNQINALININTSYDNGKIDYDKAILEFMEILPVNSDTKSQLKKDLEKSSQPVDLLTKILKDQWQTRVKMFGTEIADSILAFSVVSTLDNLWVEHLTTLDNLRDNVRLRGYAQKDPLVEYRKEGFEMFQNLMGHFEYNLARKLFRLEPVAPQEITPQNITEGRGESMENKPELPSNSNNSELAEIPPHQQPIKKGQIPGRNDLCPCGSGKKYKKCCYPKFG
jgi:preprotein translocase subunit SecA